MIRLIRALFLVCVQIGEDIGRQLAGDMYRDMDVEEDRAFLRFAAVGTAAAFALGVVLFGVDTRAYAPPIWFFIYVWSYHPTVPAPRHKTLFGGWSTGPFITVVVYRVITVLGLLSGILNGIPPALGLTAIALIVTYVLSCIVAKYQDELDREEAERRSNR